MLIGLLRTVLIIIGLYYLVRLLMWLFKKPDKTEQQGGQRGPDKKKSEGEVTIDYIPDKKKHIRKEDGDYVDFEEVDDE
jgi:hypothetical protein